MNNDIHTCSYYCDRTECIRRQRDELRDALKPDCEWQETPDGYWDTQCGHAFTMNDGGLADNNFTFCTFCGGAIREVPYNEDAASSDGGHIVPPNAIWAPNAGNQRGA